LILIGSSADVLLARSASSFASFSFLRDRRVKERQRESSYFISLLLLTVRTRKTEKREKFAYPVKSFVAIQHENTIFLKTIQYL